MLKMESNTKYLCELFQYKTDEQSKRKGKRERESELLQLNCDFKYSNLIAIETGLRLKA